MTNIFSFWILVTLFFASRLCYSEDVCPEDKNRYCAVGQWIDQTESSITVTNWQTSDLAYDSKKKVWWSIGDQNSTSTLDTKPSNYLLYRMSEVSPQPKFQPIPVSWESSDEFQIVSKAFENAKTRRIDFEGLAVHPNNPNSLMAISEGEQPWLFEIEYVEDESRAVVKRSARISVEGNHSSKARKHDWNKRWEGIALSLDGQKVFLATEATDTHDRIYEFSLNDLSTKTNASGDFLKPAAVSQLSAITAGIGEISGLSFCKYQDKILLVALERNPARISGPSKLHFIDVSQAKFTSRAVSLELRAPALNGDPKDGIEIASASPEGVACDDAGHLFLIGDPDPGFYQLKSQSDIVRIESHNPQKNKLQAKIPLFFQIPLIELLIKK